MPTEERSQYDLVLNDAFVFDGRETVDGPRSIGVKDGVITRISETRLEGRETIEAKGYWLTPGLIDSHIHMFDFANATDPAKMEAYLRDELPVYMQSFLDHGFTSVKSVGDPLPELLSTREKLASGELIGPRFFMAGVSISAPGGHPFETVYGRNPWYRDRASGQVDTPEDGRAVVAKMAEFGMDAVKLLLQGGCRCCGEPEYKWHGLVPIVRLKPEVLVAAVDEAHKQGLVATIHTIEQDRAIEALEAGVHGLEHGVVSELITDDRFVQLMLRNDVSYVPTLWVYPTPEAKQNLLTVHRAGVRVVLGTDSFCPSVKIEGIDAGMFGANSIVEAERMAECGLDAIDVLRSATGNAAIHLRRPDLGAVAEGAAADLVLFAKDPTASVDNWKKPLAVTAQGRLVVNRMAAVAH